jgi:arginine/ornithine transport system permease protein
VTLSVAAVSLAVACIFGRLGALAKQSKSLALRVLAAVYTTVIRGLPELVLMLLIFYGGQTALNQLAEPQGWEVIDVPPFLAAMMTIGFIFGAYLTETFRGALLVVPHGRIDTAQAFGLSKRQVLTRILLPQLVRHAMPGFANNWIGDGQGHRPGVHHRAGRHAAPRQHGGLKHA